MKSKEEIEQLAETYSEKIMEVAYYNFPLVHPKETVSKVITALLKEYTTQCQKDMADYIFEVARQFHRLGKYSGTISDTHFTDIYEETINSLNKQD